MLVERVFVDEHLAAYAATEVCVLCDDVAAAASRGDHWMHQSRVLVQGVWGGEWDGAYGTRCSGNGDGVAVPVGMGCVDDAGTLLQGCSGDDLAVGMGAVHSAWIGPVVLSGSERGGMDVGVVAVTLMLRQ